MPVSFQLHFFGAEHAPQGSKTLRDILRSKEKHGVELIGHGQRSLA
jgi:hypothetical protein